MARENDKIIGGFDVFKAAQRAAEENRKIARRPGEVKQGGSADRGKDADSGNKIASHIGRTVMPTKHHIMCYECGYEFDIAGKVSSTFCPKCRTNLTFEDLVVEEEYEGDLKTAGTITVKEAGVVKDGELFANFVVLYGAVEGGSLQAYNQLELGPNARVDWDCVQTRNLKIAADAEYELGACRYHDVDVHGVLRADLHATGTVTIRSTGCLEGSIRSAGLAVEEGGGLKASLQVAMGEGEAPESAESKR